MPLDPVALPKTPKRKASKGRWRDECRQCGGSLRLGKSAESAEGARRRLCPDCFERFAAGFFK